MNNQFATQFLREEVDQNWLETAMMDLGADEQLIQYTLILIEKGLIKPERALEIMKQTSGLREISSVGGGVTGGPTAATFTPGNGEQYATPGAFKKKRKYQEDAPRLAGGKKADIHTYTQDGFTKAPTAEAAGKKMKSIDVKELWEESRKYSQFKRETATRSKPDQMHEAAKMIQNKLHEIEKLLEFTSQMRSELSEGEQNLEYKNNTKKVFQKIHTKVVEVYTKVKNLK